MVLVPHNQLHAVSDICSAMLCSTGSPAVNAELSFRVKRKDIEESRHQRGEDKYYDAVRAAAVLCNLLHDEGWDEDNPSAGTLLPS